MRTNFHPDFEAGTFYHVFNRSNNNELLFRSEENFNYFLKRCNHYLGKYLEIIAYCLMPTHFHFIIKIKNYNSIPKVENLSVIVEEQFRKFFISYTKSYNKVYDRHGSLLERRFKRVRLKSKFKIIDKICYVHHNPIHHGYCENYNEWKYSTYLNFVSEVEDNSFDLLNHTDREWIVFHNEFKEKFLGKQEWSDD